MVCRDYIKERLHKCLDSNMNRKQNEVLDSKLDPLSRIIFLVMTLEIYVCTGVVSNVPSTT